MAKHDKQDAIEVKKPAGALALPDYLNDGQDQAEQLEQNDLLMPRLGQAQALSPQLKKTNEAYAPGLEVGDFFNTATGEVYGREVLVVPVKYFKQYIEFTPIDQGGGLVAQYADVSEVPPEDLKFGPNGEKPKVTEFKNRLCLLVRADGGAEPIVVSCKSSGLKTMKQWNTKILQGVGNPPVPCSAIKQLWKLVSTTRSNGQQEWEGFKVEQAGFTPAAVYPKAKDFLALLQDKVITVDTAGLADEQKAEGEKVPF